MKVTNFNGVKNQFIIYEGEKTILQSYDTVIGYIENGIYYITSNFNYSKTTSKYSTLFFGEGVIKAIKKLLKKNSFDELVNKEFETDWQVFILINNV